MTASADELLLPGTEHIRMTMPQREARVRQLIVQAHRLLDEAIDTQVLADGRELVATALMFSGGNDSTVLAHLMRERVDHAVHANTGIGIEATREFVRATCATWGLPLIERRAPREVDSYRSFVLQHGFPGPAQHYRMYQRLKERVFAAVRNELLDSPYRQRVIYLGGRRRDESERRKDVPDVERRGSIVWVSPLVNWTKVDLNTYRLMHDGNVPINQVSDLIHMSGECLCGSFAKPGERDELEYWFPLDMQAIRDLEQQIARRTDIPPHRRTWGWGADPENRRHRDARPSKTGLACSSCQPTLFDFTNPA